MSEEPIYYAASKKRRRVYRRRYDYEEIRRRHAEGEGIRSIARALGCARETVRKALRESAPTTAVSAEATASYSSTTCPRCGGRKQYDSVLCSNCRRGSWYGRDLGEEWADLDGGGMFEPTALLDIWPPPGHLSYTPRGGRYCLTASWGYVDPLSNEPSGRLAVVDAVTGVFVSETDELRVEGARRIRAGLVAEVRQLNALDAAASNGAPS